MKTQMRFQKYICLAMLILGALGLLYAFMYCTGGLSELGRNIIAEGDQKVSTFEAAEGKYDAFMYNRVQPFNNAMMYCGIVMVLLAALLFATASHSRRNYYITNYIATGLCSVSNIVMSVILMVYNTYWKGEFLKVDFAAWDSYVQERINMGFSVADQHFSDSTLWFNIGYVVYALIIVGSILLILNMVWKIMLMRGEKKLLNGNATVKEVAA